MGIYLAVTVAIGLFAGRRGGDSAEDFLLGKRNLPWWMLLLSIVATETSTVTFLSLPGKTFAAGGDFFFLQLALGYVVGRLIVVSVLLPLFFSGKFFTAYEVLQRQFGPIVRLVCSTLFVVTRTLADGLRLFLTCLVIQSATGADFTWCVIGITLCTTLYAAIGGVGSVVMNDCLQFLAYTGGAMIALFLLVHSSPDGWAGLWNFASETGRNQWVNLDGSFTTPRITLWSGLIGGGFLSMASHGADHLMVQRYLSARSQKEAGLALGLSGPLVALQFLLFLVIGVALAQFYATHPVDYPVVGGDRAFIGYIVHELGTGLTGFVLAAVVAAAMSTMSSSLNASAGVLARDGRFLLGYSEEEGDAPIDKGALRLAQLATLLFAALQASVAIAAYRLQFASSVIDGVLAIAGFTTGLVLGLYALGVTLGTCQDRVGLSALLIGFAVTASVAFGTEVSWPWYTLIGSVTTFVAGWLLARWIPTQPELAT